MNKKITIIVNPASGKKDSVLWSINNAFYKKNIDWKIEITRTKDDAHKLAKEELKKNPKYLGVYGGDGTVAEVAKAMHKTNTAMFIIPGGTNNVIAKELGISTDVDEALSRFTKTDLKIKSMDMGLYKNKPFILRIETGLIAKIIKNTKRSSKRALGQLSYAAQVIPQLNNQKIRNYKIKMDDKKEISASGLSLVIANIGNVGIEGYSIVPNIKINDGILDVVLFKEKPLESAVAWIKSTVANKKPQGVIEHWKVKRVSVTFERQQIVNIDDQTFKTNSLDVEVSPSALKVVVP